MNPSVFRIYIFGFILFFSAILPAAAQEQNIEQEAAIYANLETFANILDLLQKHYIEEVNSAEILIGAVRGMLNLLDPHSAYLSPEDFKDLQEDTSGVFIGVGIEVTVRDGILTVVAPISGSPAFQQGVKAGDQILKINGRSTKDMGLSDAVKHLRGKRGETVSITVGRAGLSQAQDIVLVRDLIPNQSVLVKELAPGIQHIYITNFQAATTKDFRQILQDIEQKEALKGIILDLRNNPGGLLEQAIRVADVFIERGVLVSTRGRNKKDEVLFEAHPGTDKYTVPLVVLVNGGSASAAEIVAGALQDHGRGIILGTKTFGKGSVQTVVPLPDGAGLRLTTARYYTPKGHSIQETGITPDIIVPLDETGEGQGDSFRQLREKDLHRHLEHEHSDSKQEGLSRKEGELEEMLAADNQLRNALFILQMMLR